MPIDLSWDEKRRIWELTTGESFTLEEVAALVEKTDWHGARRFLWDLRDLQEGPGSLDEIQQAAEIVERGHEIWAGGHSALVVSRDLDFGIARMFLAFSEGRGIEYRIFRDKGEALDWLEAQGGA